MFFRFLADAIIVVHLAFIVFAVAGAALLMIRRVPRWLAVIHLACAVWASYVMFSGRICPLTPLENHFQRLSGEAGYEGSFIERYLLGVIYPEGLTRDVQVALGLGVALLNAIIYTVVLTRKKSG